MKILYINYELQSADGCNAHAVGMLKALQENLGEENVWAFPQGSDNSGVQVKQSTLAFKRHFSPFLKFVRYFRKKMLSKKNAASIIQELERDSFIPTHIVARCTMFDNTAELVKRHFGCKLISEFNTPIDYETSAQDPYFSGLVKKWEKNLLEISDRIYCVSEICASMLVKQYDVSRNKFIIVPNGYSKELFPEGITSDNKSRQRTRAELGLEDKFVITFVGSLKSWHGIELLCKIASIMSDDNVMFLVIGDGDRRSVIQEYIGKNDNMLMLGKVSHVVMKKYLHASDLGIMPYLNDNPDAFYFSPLKMFDLLGASLPFLSTDIGQISEICKESLTDDFLIDSINPVDWKYKLSSIKANKLNDMRLIVLDKRANHTWSQRAKNLINNI